MSNLRRRGSRKKKKREEEEEEEEEEIKEKIVEPSSMKSERDRCVWGERRREGVSEGDDHLPGLNGNV